jgi:hypothetical protein
MSLYTSASGKAVNHASSSALDLFKGCRRKFYLEKIQGWKQKDKKGSLEFGKAVEAAVQFFYENGCKSGDAVDHFKMIWLKFADIPLKFTDQENNWSDLYKMGSELTKLFEVVYDTLPIKHPKFQLEYRKKVFPGSQYDDLEFLGYIDILSTLDDGDRIIVDMKTAKQGLDLTPNMLAMDGQLRKYSWLTGVPKVAFLNFIKAGNPDSFKKGTAVTLLEDESGRLAGESFLIYKVETQEDDDGSELLRLTLTTPETVQKMDEELNKISGKGSKEAKEKIIARYFEEKLLFVVDRPAVTKTRIQYVQAYIGADDAAEVGDAVGLDMMQLKYAVDNNTFPKDGGVRWPNNNCVFCPCRGICLKNDTLRDEMLVQIGGSHKEDDREDDWLSELEG